MSRPTCASCGDSPCEHFLGQFRSQGAALSALVEAMDGLVFHRHEDGKVEVVKGATSMREWTRLLEAMEAARAHYVALRGGA